MWVYGFAIVLGLGQLLAGTRRLQAFACFGRQLRRSFAAPGAAGR
jgi:hypothetical protein